LAELPDYGKKQSGTSEHQKYRHDQQANRVCIARQQVIPVEHLNRIAGVAYLGIAASVGRKSSAEAVAAAEHDQHDQ